MNPRERESKLEALRNPPLGPRNVVDPSVFDRPVGHAFRKEELDAMLALAGQGIQLLLAKQRLALGMAE